jgi:hypothetical protein
MSARRVVTNKLPEAYTKACKKDKGFILEQPFAKHDSQNQVMAMRTASGAQSRPERKARHRCNQTRSRDVHLHQNVYASELCDQDGRSYRVHV